MNPILLEFAGRQSDAGSTSLPESYKQLVVNAQLFFKSRKGVTDVADYRLNLRKGRVSLIKADKTEVAADAQIIGTYSNDGSFMWGWSHPDAPEPMQAAAWAVQQFGERQEIEELLSRGGETSSERLDEFLAIAAYLSNADGVYMGDHGGGGQVCIAYYLGDQLKVLSTE